MNEEKDLESMELDEESLEEILGGMKIMTLKFSFTVMRCSKCDRAWPLKGNHMNNERYDCRKCDGKGTSYGWKLLERL